MFTGVVANFGDPTIIARACAREIATLSLFEVTKINDISVLVIKCEKTRGKEIIYLNDVVYVRTGPRIDQLSTKEVVDLFKDKLDI